MEVEVESEKMLSATRTKTSGWGPLITRTASTSDQEIILSGETRDRAPRCGRTSNENDKSRHSTRLGARSKLSISIGPSRIAKTLNQSRFEAGSPLASSRPRRGSWSKVMFSGSSVSGAKKASISRTTSIASITTTAASITRTGSQSSRRGSILETFTRAPSIKSIKSNRRGSILETATVTSNHRGSILEPTSVQSNRRSSILEAPTGTSKRRGSICETISHAPSTTKEASAWPMITRSASAAMEIDFQELGFFCDTPSTL
mmetsp:Transcript_41293/g.60796  ORF Transcript_41293/g.60796 Transcript_41293/m.60796 type:complete len:261 (-) Transcript_41293:157-939(-)